MRAEEVCTILKAKLPQVSDTFSESVLTSSLLLTSGVLTVTTTTNHGLAQGDFITLSAFNVAVDYPLIDSDIINTRHQITAIISPTVYTVTIVQLFVSGPSSTAGKTHTKVAVMVALDESLAEASYVRLGTKTNIAYVIDGGMAVSRDRKSEGDTIQTALATTDFRIVHINTFSVLVFISLENDTIGTNVSNALRLLLVHLNRALTGVRLSTDWNENKSRGLTLTGMSALALNDAYVAEAYTFEEIEFVTGLDASRDCEGFMIQDIFLTVEPNFK